MQTSNQTSNQKQTSNQTTKAPESKAPEQIQAATLAAGATLAPSDGVGPEADQDSILCSTYQAQRVATLSNHSLLVKAVVKAADRDAVNETLRRIRGKVGMLKSARKSGTVAQS